MVKQIKNSLTNLLNFCNRVVKVWSKDENTEIYSMHNERVC